MFIPLSMFLLNDLADPVFDDVGLAGFKSIADAFLLAYAAHSHLVYYCFPALVFLSLVLWGIGVWTDSMFSQPCIADLF